MGVERVDYLSENDYQEALIDEVQSWNEWEQAHQEPDVVPCFRCGGQMYQECHAPEGNICSTCEKGESKMDNCCISQTTPHCPTCGADLEAKSLVGLKKHLESRLQSARDRLAKWVNKTAGDEEKVKQGIARNTDTIIQLDSWVEQLGKIIPHVPTG